MKTEELETAIKLATECHEGQFRNDGVTPYIEHPKRVAQIVEHPKRVAQIVEQLGGGEQEITVAWLHHAWCNGLKYFHFSVV